MGFTLIVVGVIFVFFAIAFYVPRCFDEYDPYKPFNFYIALPAIGILFFAGSFFLMGASGNESSSIFFAVLVNVILCVIHILVHARKYGIMFAIINYIVHLGMNHHPHETRHTFITRAKLAGVDEYSLKLIVGHQIGDVTERVYTHRTIESLRQEIEKIK